MSARVSAALIAVARSTSAFAQALPPGWTPRGPYDEEKTFLAPQASAKVAQGVRQLSSDISEDKKLKGGVISPRILIDKP